MIKKSLPAGKIIPSCLPAVKNQFRGSLIADKIEAHFVVQRALSSTHLDYMWVFNSALFSCVFL